MHEYVHINQYGKAYYRIALHSIFPYGFTSTPLLTPDSSARKHRESLAFQEKTPSLMNICMTISCPFDHDAFLSVWEVHVPFCSRGLRLKNHLGWGVSTCFELSNVNKTGGDIHSSRLKPLSKASPVFFTALLQQPVFIQNQANLLQEKRESRRRETGFISPVLEATPVDGSEIPMPITWNRKTPCESLGITYLPTGERQIS